MYDFTGCECVICHQRFKPDSDVVVCPDCGTPYHRDCYHQVGHCKHQASHGTDFAWQPPEQQTRTTMTTCPRCNTENEKTNEYCKHCGLSLVIFKDIKGQGPDKDALPYNKKTQNSPNQYQYNSPRQGVANAHADALKNAQMLYGKRISTKETFEEITVSDWVSYIGLASPSYLMSFQQMKARNRKYNFSFSALFFGPLYFFYRKAWDVALAFSIITLLLNVPSFLAILIYTESVYAPAISEDMLSIVSQVCVTLSWVFMMLRGLYGTYLYKMSSARKIKKIQTQEQAQDPERKSFLLQMYGGTSVAAVAIVLAVVFALASGFGTMMGPEVDAMLEAFYY